VKSIAVVPGISVDWILLLPVEKGAPFEVACFARKSRSVVRNGILGTRLKEDAFSLIRSSRTNN